jgi:predicted metal-dependent HD superfamily phosphohydrolase
MDETADGLRTRLTERYAEPHRHYHDRQHLQEVLAGVEELADAADEIEAVRWAAWYHDAVYDVHRHDNEEQSARLAEEELAGAGCEPALAAAVGRLVRLTATHDPADDDRDGAVLCDADLRILAAPPDRYAQYAADVRREYAHVAEPEFRTGRAAVLRALLAQPRLYKTEQAHARWEDRARANVTAELRELESA